MASKKDNRPTLRLIPVGERGMLRDWKGKPRRAEYEGVVCRAGRRVVGSLDWEDALDGISIEHMWVDPDFRSSPAVLLRLIRYLDGLYPDKEISAGEYANPRTEKLIDALNRRPRRLARGKGS